MAVAKTNLLYTIWKCHYAEKAINSSKMSAMYILFSCYISFCKLSSTLIVPELIFKVTNTFYYWIFYYKYKNLKRWNDLQIH